MRRYPDVGILSGSLLLPNDSLDRSKWSVIACDQFTSQPDYWHQVREIVGDSPSTLYLVLPEAYLGTSLESPWLDSIRETSQRYLGAGILQEFDGMIYVERVFKDSVRHGLVLSIDLETYGFEPDSHSLIRATEATIFNRLPPRVRTRQTSSLETSHILVLIDDRECSVIEPLTRQKSRLVKEYSVELMLNGGHITGYRIHDVEIEKNIITALRELSSPSNFSKKYGVDPSTPPFLYAVGDGNHSLASAKVYWDSIKENVSPDHPARYALVEIINLHDSGLKIEPIHRLLTGAPPNFIHEIIQRTNLSAVFHSMPNFESMQEIVEKKSDGLQRIGIITANQFGILSIEQPAAVTAVGTIQSAIDSWITIHPEVRLDFIHDTDAIVALSQKPGNTGIYLSAISKDLIFPTILREGVLPRKAFSMGHSREKRFYLECRKIIW